jgi:hypothetical protein
MRFLVHSTEMPHNPYAFARLEIIYVESPSPACSHVPLRRAWWRSNEGSSSTGIARALSVPAVTPQRTVCTEIYPQHRCYCCTMWLALAFLWVDATRCSIQPLPDATASLLASSHHDGWAVCLTRLAGSNGYLPAWTRPALPAGWLGWFSPGQAGLDGLPALARKYLFVIYIHKPNHKQSQSIRNHQRLWTPPPPPRRGGAPPDHR